METRAICHTVTLPPKANLWVAELEKSWESPPMVMENVIYAVFDSGQDKVMRPGLGDNILEYIKTLPKQSRIYFSSETFDPSCGFATSKKGDPPTAYEKLREAIQKSALEQGIILVSNGSGGSATTANQRQLICQYSLKYRKNKSYSPRGQVNSDSNRNPIVKRQCITKRPTDDAHKCPFRLLLRFDKHGYYVYCDGKHERHCFHQHHGRNAKQLVKEQHDNAAGAEGQTGDSPSSTHEVPQVVNLSAYDALMPRFKELTSVIQDSFMQQQMVDQMNQVMHQMITEAKANLSNQQETIPVLL